MTKKIAKAKVYANLFSRTRLPLGIESGCLHVVVEYIYLSDPPRSGKFDFISDPFASISEFEDEMKMRLKDYLRSLYPNEPLSTREIVGPSA